MAGMKRVMRIIFNGVTVLSLLLCVATVGLWLRSYRVIQESVWIPAGASNKGYGFQSGLGEITLTLLVSSGPLGVNQSKYQSIHVNTGRQESHRRWLEADTWHGFALNPTFALRVL